MAKRKGSELVRTIRDMVRAQPFQPFDLKTTDGDTFNVFHPEFFMISPNETLAVQFDKDGHFRTINLRHVVSVEPARSKGKSFGGPGKK